VRFFQAWVAASHNIHPPAGVRIDVIPPERYDDVIEHLKHYFIPDETIAKSIAMEWTDELELFFRAALGNGLCLMAVDIYTGDIMGVRLNEIKTSSAASDPEFVSDDPKLNTVMAFGEYKKRVIGKLFERFNVSEIFHLFILSVDGRYRRRGLGKLLLSAGAALAKELGFTVLNGEASSLFSQRIYDSLEFDMICQINYADYIVDGKVVFNKTGIHPSLKIYTKVI
jgi:GNAT superfamily N-acetyltransferase